MCVCGRSLALSLSSLSLSPKSSTFTGRRPIFTTMLNEVDEGQSDGSSDRDESARQPARNAHDIEASYSDTVASDAGIGENSLIEPDLGHEETSLLESGNGAAVADHDPYAYPSHPHQDDLACVPELPCGQYQKIGKLYVFSYRTNAKGNEIPHRVVGPCWPMLLVTNCLIIGITLLAIFSYIRVLHWFVPVLGVVVLTIVVWALFKTSCSNPGIIPRCDKPENSSWRWSEQSQSYYPPGATYCTESQVIVTGYDHFCPWTGTTIAGGNMRYFTCFVSTLGVLCMYVIFVVVIGSAAVASKL